MKIKTKTKILRIMVVSILFLLSSSVVSAHVNTSSIIEEKSNTVYVAGNADFYPIEYYNSRTGRFEGVMPQILEHISSKTGLNFTYVSSKNMTQTELANNLQVEMVSSYIIGSITGYAADAINVFSYEDESKMVNVGFAFTLAADKETVKLIKNEVSKLPQSQINNCFISNYTLNRQNESKTVLTLALFCIFFVACIVIVWLRTKVMLQKLKENKMTDDDTGIGNLTYFKNLFEKRITEYSRTRYYLAYIVVDNNFLQLYHGESLFTDVVRYTANVLSSHSNNNEFSARITESGFALAFQALDDDDAKQYIETILEQLNESVNAADKKTEAVFRAAVYKLKKEDYNCELLLFNLRRNCNELLGTDTQLVFCDTYAMNSAAENKKLIESFYDGFKNKEFKLYLQFIVDNKTKNIVSAEALSRWENPVRGLLTPYHYISTMENVGMINELDFYMFEMVCRQLHKWRDTEFGNVSLSCNFTRITLSEDNFIDKIKEISNKYVFDKSKLIIEITEDAIEKNREIALGNVFKAKELGFLIALDDLGSGYTSLTNLCDYPVDIVKLDRDILLKTENANGKELFKGVVALAHNLNKRVVCEGVETQEHNEFVSDSDCNYIQGWYYSKPSAANESEELYRMYKNKIS